ncbi:MAG: SAM-dependent methyltransferase [Paraglaciecola sp.]|jgi:SAM-dependent methyltransferase
MPDYFKNNQELWDEKVPVHLQSEMYDLKNFKKGKTSLNSFELEGLGEVAGQKMLHLQCHFGLDSLSWARMGAKVTGVDLSPVAIQTAKDLNKELGLDAEFLVSNILELDKNLKGQFDTIFTSYGTIVWLPDLDEWARIINHFLKPGGTFYIVDFHPVIQMFDWENSRITYPYFNRKVFYEEEEGTYANPDADLKHGEYFWFHSLSETMGALMKQGLQLVDFQEFDWSPYNCFPNMTEVEKEKYVYYPKAEVSEKVRLPQVYSMKVQKKES